MSVKKSIALNERKKGWSLTKENWISHSLCIFPSLGRNHNDDANVDEPSRPSSSLPLHLLSKGIVYYYLIHGSPSLSITRSIPSTHFRLVLTSVHPSFGSRHINTPLLPAWKEAKKGGRLKVKAMSVANEEREASFHSSLSLHRCWCIERAHINLRYRIHM